MKTREPSSLESSVKRSTRAEGVSVEKRSLHSYDVVGGMYLSSKEMCTVDGATTGCGVDGTDDTSASWYEVAMTALENVLGIVK